jgi:hypothetical protein
MAYTKWMGARLSERVREIADATSELNLREELDLARALIGDTLALRARVEAENPEGLKRDAAVVKCSDVILKQLRHIESMALTSAKIDQIRKLDAATLEAVVLQVAQIVDEELRMINGQVVDSHEVAHRGSRCVSVSGRAFAIDA